jgi:hypothetical protein
MARYRDDGEVQIDNSTNGHFRIAFQWLIVIAAFNVGTLLGFRRNLVAATTLSRGQAIAVTDNDGAASLETLTSVETFGAIPVTTPLTSVVPIINVDPNTNASDPRADKTVFGERRWRGYRQSGSSDHAVGHHFDGVSS